MAEYIEREALILAFNLTAERSGDPDCPWDMSAIETEIEAMPSADVVPAVNGQWVQKDSRNPFSWRTCSECGYAVTAAQARVYKGCPKCLARMDGDGNE